MEIWLFFLLSFTALTAGTPVTRRPLDGLINSLQPVSRPTCAAFRYDICNTISNGQGYNSGVFPNPLAPHYLSTPLGAQGEASVIIPWAISTNCSQYITQFLCFAIFPLCVSSSVPPVLPCRSMCERVRCECEAALKASESLSRWPEWLNCDQLERVLGDYGATGVCMEADVNETCTSASANPTTSTPTTSTHKFAPPPTLSSHGQDYSSLCDAPCGDCSLFTELNASTLSMASANYSFGTSMMLHALIMSGIVREKKSPY